MSGNQARARLTTFAILVASGYQDLDTRVGYVLAKHDCRLAGLEADEIRAIVDQALDLLWERAAHVWGAEIACRRRA